MKPWRVGWSEDGRRFYFHTPGGYQMTLSGRKASVVAEARNLLPKMLAVAEKATGEDADSQFIAAIRAAIDALAEPEREEHDKYSVKLVIPIAEDIRPTATALNGFCFRRTPAPPWVTWEFKTWADAQAFLAIRLAVDPEDRCSSAADYHNCAVWEVDGNGGRDK